MPDSQNLETRARSQRFLPRVASYESSVHSDVIRRQVRYVGRVQGVGFRATTRHLATGFAVTGWVQNEPDGSVLLEAQGGPDELDRFLAALGQRLRANIVSAIAAQAAIVPDETGFSIRR